MTPAEIAAMRERAEDMIASSSWRQVGEDVIALAERLAVVERERDEAVRHRAETNEEIGKLHRMIRAKGFSVEDSVAFDALRTAYGMATKERDGLREKLAAEVCRLTEERTQWVGEAQEEASAAVARAEQAEAALAARTEKHDRTRDEIANRLYEERNDARAALAKVVAEVRDVAGYLEHRHRCVAALESGARSVIDSLRAIADRASKEPTP